MPKGAAGNKCTAAAKLRELRRDYNLKLNVLHEHERQAARAKVTDQVLVDLILHMEFVRIVRESLDTKVQQQQQTQAPPSPSPLAAPQQQQQQQQSMDPDTTTKSSSSGSSSSMSCQSYVGGILDSLTPEDVQRARQWSAEDVAAEYCHHAQQLLPALEILERPEGYTTPEAAEALKGPAMQQLGKAVDGIARLIVLFGLYAEDLGGVGFEVCSWNLLTCNLSIPDSSYWLSAVQRMQPEEWQLELVAAAYLNFKRNVRALAAEGRRLTVLDAQAGLLLATLHSSTTPSSSSFSSLSSSGSGSSGEAYNVPTDAEIAAAAAAAAAGRSDAQATPAALEQQLNRYVLRLTNVTWGVWIVLLNTFSNVQLAHLTVAAFPFIARPGPVAEALFHLYTQLQQQPQQQHAQHKQAHGAAVTAVAASAGAALNGRSSSGVIAADPVFQQALQQHRQERLEALDKQQQCWWQQQQQQEQQQQQQQQE